MSAVSTVHRHFQANTHSAGGKREQTHNRRGRDCDGLTVYRRPTLCVYTERFCAAGCSTKAPLALRTQRLTMRNWRFNNLYWCCPSLIAATWWAGDEKCHLKKMKPGCDPRVCNIFYRREAAARRQNPGSARRTAANADVAVITPWE